MVRKTLKSNRRSKVKPTQKCCSGCPQDLQHHHQAQPDLKSSNPIDLSFSNHHHHHHNLHHQHYQNSLNLINRDDYDADPRRSKETWETASKETSVVSAVVITENMIIEIFPSKKPAVVMTENMVIEIFVSK